MFKLRPILIFSVGAGLLQACVAPPAREELTMHPVQRIRHSADQTAASYYQLARYHQERGDLDVAISAYTHSITLDGRQLEPRNALAALLAKQGRLGEAKAVLLQVVSDFPTVAHPYNNLGYVYYLQGNYDAAVATLQRALTLDSTNDRARNNLNLARTAVATRRELATIELALSPAVAAAKGVSSDTANVQRAVVPSPDGMEPGVAPAPAPSAPQARIELAQVVPNVYELRPKTGAVQLAAHATAVSAPEAKPIPAPVATSAISASRLEVANGNGVPGMAKRIGRALGQHGIAVSRLTNERPYRRQTTEIQYRPGYEQAAEQLKSAMQGHAAMALANNSLVRSDVRLVLGKDAVAHIALIEGSAGRPRLAINGK